MGNKKKLKDYAIYQGDSFLFVGNVYECANYLNVKTDTIRFMTYSAYKKRIKENSKALEVICLEN